ncbi:probable E3 ubiquitin-protein ligase TRIML1 [Lacerta agilis]|uniref:probable E3 ubiquitin-protein ligase TRIML1 n=1 Tax=Lacerta agilis TaxID=80427 RepID=UPI0014195731|nr:probable E3 ubiquitin-protein ligase TRIML1 [Lacerta agilis]
MAAGGNLGQEEMTCPICLQRFLDPVITDCGHSFCHACLIQSWSDSDAAGCCPRCGKPFKEGSYKRIHELARHAGESTKSKEGEGAKSKTGRCDEPKELLEELSCEGGDQMVRGNEGGMTPEGMPATAESTMLVVMEEDINCPICKEYFTDLVILDCGHNFCKACINQYYETWEKIDQLKCPVCQTKIQKGNYRPNWQLTNIVENCKRYRGTLCERHKEKLILFCKEDRELLCSKCEHSPQHSQHSLVLLEYIEQEIRRTLNRSKHEEEVGHKLVNHPNFEESLNICSQKNSALIKNIEKLEGSIFLDPSTAYPYLIVSDDLKSVRWGDGKQDVPMSPERFYFDPCVLGCKKFGSGRHLWEVEVGMEVKEEEAEWAVGVVRESFQRNAKSILRHYCGIWAVGKERNYPSCCLWAFTSPNWTMLRLEHLPKKIKVSLDYEKKDVEFFDADLDKLIFKFCPAFFDGEMIIPCLWVGRGVTLKC